MTFDVVESFKIKHEVIESFQDGIYRSDSWLHDVLVFEEDSVQESGSARSLDKDDVSVIVFRRSTDVPTICGVFAPCSTAIWFDMELNCAAKQNECNSVIVKRAVVVSVGRYLGGNSGLTE